MKKYLTTIISLIVVVVVVVAAVVVLKVTGGSDDEPDTTAAPDDTQYAYIFTLEGSIVKLESSYENEYTLEYVTEDETSVWQCTNNDSLTLYNDTVVSLVSTINGSQGILVSRSAEIDDYGFQDGKSNIFVRLTDDTGASQTAYVGNVDYSGSYQYMHVEGSEDIIKVNTATASRFKIKKEALVEKIAFAYLSTDIPKTFMVYENGEKTLELSCKEVDEEEGAIWTVKYPIERDAESSTANDLISAMQKISLSGIAKEDATEDDLEEYGLAPATIEYYYFLTDEEGKNMKRYQIKVGNKTEDGSYYYCIIEDMVDGHCDIYTVSTGSVYRSVDVLTFIDTFLYVKDSDELQTVEIDFEGQHHTMRYEYKTTKTTDENGEVTENTVTTRYWDGKEAIDDDDLSIVVSDNRFTVPTAEDRALNHDDDVFNDVITANPYDVFNKVLNSIYTCFMLNEIDLNQPAEEDLGEKIITVTLTEVCGDVYKIELYKRTATTAYAYINGNYAGGYVRTTQLYGDDYANYDLLKTLEAMNIVINLY